MSNPRIKLKYAYTTDDGFCKIVNDNSEDTLRRIVSSIVEDYVDELSDIDIDTNPHYDDDNKYYAFWATSSYCPWRIRTQIVETPILVIDGSMFLLSRFLPEEETLDE